MSEWMVRLSGVSTVLESLKNLLAGNKHVAIVRDGEEVVLRANQFSQATDSRMVLTMANELLNTLNSVACLECPGFESVVPQIVVEVLRRGRQVQS